MIEVDGLTFHYDHSVVLDRLTFKIQSSEFVGIIGPNGAGKSTLLRVLGGLLKPQAGRVLIDGKELSSYPLGELARLVSFIPQETHFSLNFKVWDVVLQGRYPFLGFFKIETKKDIEAVQEALRKTRIDHLADKSILNLSSGERQLVVIARAIAQTSRILLLDEPTTFLDIHHQMEIMSLLKQLNDEGKTIVMVIHDLNLAALFTTRLILIDRGRIVAQGSPEEVISEDQIERVYQLKVTRIKHPARRLPQILLG